EQVGDATAVADEDATGLAATDVLHLEAKAAIRMLDWAYYFANEVDIPLGRVDRARRQLRDTRAGERRVEDEDRECGCYRQRDHEPRWTGSHARIVAPPGEAERRY